MLDYFKLVSQFTNHKMVRSALADDYLLSYLKDIAGTNTCTVGLILGQHCQGKDYIIHFAKTPPFQSDELKDRLPAKKIKSILEVNDKWVADHARHATRMLPGGMFVLGIFIISPDDLLSQFSSKIKAILTTIHKHLDGNCYLFGNRDTEKLVLNYCTKTDNYMAKSYDVVTTRVQPVNFKFLPKANRWNNVECSYVIDQLYYLKTNEADWPLQKHIKGVLEDINKSLENSIFFYDGDFKDGEDSLEIIISKKKKVPRSSPSSKNYLDSQDVKPIQVSIFQNPADESPERHEVFQSAGQLRIIGQVACKLWLNPKISINEASRAVKEDIMRSLSTRLEMHWDSLTEEENLEDINCVHEPPRRVLITLPNSKITLSDYLFPGEGAQDAKISLEELLDIKIDDTIEIQDVEGQADISEYYTSGMDTESEEALPQLPTDANKFMYIMGMGVALLVLICSLLIHFFYKQ